VGQDFECEMEARPGPPRAEFGILAGYSGGEMLEMPDGVADKEALLSMVEVPDECRIGSWRVYNHRGLVELKDGLGGFSLKPQ